MIEGCDRDRRAAVRGTAEPADPRTREPANLLRERLEAGVFPGGSGVRPTLSAIEISE